MKSIHLRICVFFLLLLKPVISFSQGKDSIKNNAEIIDPVDSASVIINKKSDYLLIPKSIKGKEKNGVIVAQLKVTRTNKIAGYTLQYCKLVVDNCTLLDFYHDTGSDKSVGRYNEQIMKTINLEVKQYLSDQVIIKRLDLSQKFLVYKISILLR
ncbi:hypothetical protein GCM10027051_29720 [Niabella terrae]